MIALTGPSVPLAFLAGLASFLSPCVFPLVPVYAAYLGGRASAGVPVAVGGTTVGSAVLRARLAPIFWRKC